MPTTRSATLTSIYGAPQRNASGTSPNKTIKKKSQPEWNDYLTDENRFKLSKEEMLKKKRMYVSKHNIFLSAARTSRPKATKKGSSDPNEKKLREAAAVLNQKSEDPLLHLTSLDYLGDEDEHAEFTEEANILSGGDLAQSEKVHDGRQGRQKLSFQVKKEPDNSVAPTSHQETTFHPVRSPSKRLIQKSPRMVVEPMEDVKFNSEISALLRGLHGELKYYEELSGRRSVFDATASLIYILNNL
jgi:hypothetical protein